MIPGAEAYLPLYVLALKSTYSTGQCSLSLGICITNNGVACGRLGTLAVETSKLLRAAASQ